MKWTDVLDAIEAGNHSIPTTDDGLPLVAVNAPFYELMQLMAAITKGYNGLVARVSDDQKKIERIRKLARGAFPAERPGVSDASDGWVAVEDMLPPKSGYYLTYDADGPFMGVYAYHYSAVHEMFNTQDFVSADEAEKVAIHVTHWHPFPMPPKMVRRVE